MGSETDYGFKKSDDAPETAPDSPPPANEEQPQQELVPGASEAKQETGDSSTNTDESGVDIPPVESPSATKEADGSYISRAGLKYTMDTDGDRHYDEASVEAAVAAKEDN